MIILLLVAALVLFGIGAACGFVIGSRQLPRMLAKMDESQVDELADKVRELRRGTS